jgi:hypothetical protein
LLVSSQLKAIFYIAALSEVNSFKSKRARAVPINQTIPFSKINKRNEEAEMRRMD